MLIPTTFMGATLPIISKYCVTDDSRMGTQVSLLYALNTLGAAFRLPDDRILPDGNVRSSANRSSGSRGKPVDRDQRIEHLSGNRSRRRLEVSTTSLTGTAHRLECRPEILDGHQLYLWIHSFSL